MRLRGGGVASIRLAGLSRPAGGQARSKYPNDWLDEYLGAGFPMRDMRNAGSSNPSSVILLLSYFEVMGSLLAVWAIT